MRNIFSQKKLRGLSLPLLLCIMVLLIGCVGCGTDDGDSVTTESDSGMISTEIVTTTPEATASTTTAPVTTTEQYTTEEIIDGTIGEGVLDGPSSDADNGMPELATVGESSVIMANEYRYFMTSYRRQILDEAQIDETDEAAVGFWTALDASGTSRADMATELIMNELHEMKVLEQVAADQGLSLDVDETANLATDVLMDIDFYGGVDAFLKMLAEYGVSISDYYKILQLTAVRDKLLTWERDSITISEGDARDYYDSNPDVYSDVVTLRQILLLLEGDDLEHIRTDDETRLLADNVHDRVSAGEDIAVLAKELSEASDASATGGLTAVTKADETLPQEVLNWAFAADISDTTVIETAFGFYIVRVEDRHQQPFESVREKIVETLKDARLAERVGGWTRDTKYGMTVNGEALASAAQGFR